LSPRPPPEARIGNAGAATGRATVELSGNARLELSGPLKVGKNSRGVLPLRDSGYVEAGNGTVTVNTTRQVTYGALHVWRPASVAGKGAFQ